MKRILPMLVALLCVVPSWAECTSPATGTLEDAMTQATWTVETGSDSNNNRNASVRIALPALDVLGRDCLTWSVELVLPRGVTLAAERATTVRSNLAADAAATFAVVVEAASHSNEIRYERGWLRVKVRNPDEDTGLVLHRTTGSPLWLYPVNFQFGDD